MPCFFIASKGKYIYILLTSYIYIILSSIYHAHARERFFKEKGFALMEKPHKR